MSSRSRVLSSLPVRTNRSCYFYDPKHPRLPSEITMIISRRKEHFRLVASVLQGTTATTRATSRRSCNSSILCASRWRYSCFSTLSTQKFCWHKSHSYRSKVDEHREAPTLMAGLAWHSRPLLCARFLSTSQVPSSPIDEEEHSSKGSPPMAHDEHHENTTSDGTVDTTKTSESSKSQMPKSTKKQRRNRTPRKATSSKNDPSSPFLQLRKEHSKDTIQEQFEQLASQTELSKLTFVRKLRDKLMTLPQVESKEDDVTFNDTFYWKETEKYLDSRKSIPKYIKHWFWHMIFAPTGKTRKNQYFTPGKVTNKDIQILQTARDKAAQHPMVWNHKYKHRLGRLLVEEDKAAEQSKLKTLRKEAIDTYMADRAKKLTQIHQAVSSGEQRKQARRMAQTLRSKLPEAYYRKLMVELDEYRKRKESRQKKNLLHLFKPLHSATRSHVHKVAPDLIDFFYITTNTLDIQVDDDDDDDDGAHESTNIMTNVLSFDEKIDKSKGAWDKERQTFVEAFQKIQSLLLEEHHHNVLKCDSNVAEEEQEQKQDLISPDQADYDEDVEELDEAALTIDWSIRDDDDDGENDIEDIEGNIDDDNSEGTNERVYDTSEESVMSTFQEEAKTPPGIKENKKPILKPRHYVVFEAISVGDLTPDSQASSFLGDDTTSKKLEGQILSWEDIPTDRLVFIDNLPIDVTEDQLLDAYSRCGSIDKVDIFHRRPDLDPGRKSEDSKKKIRKPSSGRKAWQRPRTPLYATILYSDEKGAKKATGDALRIFGMIIDKHLIRSHRACDMTKLYLEDVAAKRSVSSIEYELSQILDPTLYVCLDIERRRQRVTRGSLSCEIKFPSFEAAYWAHAKLSSELPFLEEEEPCSLHWMQTPYDAMLFWTRQLNF